jgi:hypothetical protein
MQQLRSLEPHARPHNIFGPMEVPEDVEESIATGMRDRECVLRVLRQSARLPRTRDPRRDDAVPRPRRYFIFPGIKLGRPLSDMTLSKLVRAMGYDCVPHGFRASFKTWAEQDTDHPTVRVLRPKLSFHCDGPSAPHELSALRQKRTSVRGRRRTTNQSQVQLSTTPS